MLKKFIMVNNASWLKQEYETDATYARFCKFLDFDGSLAKFASASNMSLQTV